MPKLPAVTPKKLIKVLEAMGFVKLRSKGSHFFFVHKDGRKTVVPMHGKDLPKGTFSAILKDIQITAEVFTEIMKK